MCKQAERDQESRKLVILMERVKRQIAEQQNPALKKPSIYPSSTDSGFFRMPSKSVPFER